MEKYTKKQVEEDIQEFIEYNKTNEITNDKNCEEVENKYCVTNIEKVDEYYTATISGKDVIKFDDGTKQEVKWTGNVDSDWSGEEITVNDIEHNFTDEDDEKNDIIEEFVEERAKEFVKEYINVNQDYFDNMTSFWNEKDYQVYYEKFTMTITGNGYIIETTNWDNKSLDDFEINEDED